LRRVRLSLSQNRFIAKNGSIAFPYSFEHHWPAKTSFASIESSQLVFVEAFPHIGYRKCG
jgi:hypothetical protein